MGANNYEGQWLPGLTVKHLSLSVHISPVSHLQDDDNEMFIFNTVEDSIISDTNSIDIVQSP